MPIRLAAAGRRRAEWMTRLALGVQVVAVAAVTGWLLIPAYWYVWIILVAVDLAMVLYWFGKKYTYQCVRCGTEYKVPLWQDFWGGQGLTRGQSGRIYAWKLLPCPKCQRRERALPVKRGSSLPKPAP